MPDAGDPDEPQRRLTPAGAEKARQEWEPWCRALGLRSDHVEAALRAVLDSIGVGLSADVVAALVRVRSGISKSYIRDRGAIAWEMTHCDRVRRELPAMVEIGVISRDAAQALDREYLARLDALATWSVPISAAAAPAAPARPLAGSPAATAAAQPSATAAAPPRPSKPAEPPVSLRDLFAEHSVLILASFGAFLLVVATVLFELYGTVGLGGSARFAAVVALDAIFALAGFFALRRPNLRSVGQIYTALAAVLLPLVGLAAWTFLELDRRGITIDQAVAVTGLACALAYGVLAVRLDLRAYGEMSGVAIFAAAVGVSGSVGGSHWRAVALALAPLVYGACERYVRSRTFSHFPWFAHATALVAVFVAVVSAGASDWLWTYTLAALGTAYLAWQAISPDRSRGWAGEAALVLAAAAASGPLGLTDYHFLLPMALGVPLIAFARASHRLGVAGRLYRAHPALLHIAIACGVFLAAAQDALGQTWPLATALWAGFVLYAVDAWFARDARSGYAVRAAPPLAVVATAQALGLGTWTAAAVALTLFAYLGAWTTALLEPLRRHASYFFFAVLALAALNLDPVDVVQGHWQNTITLGILAVAFAIASELEAVRIASWAARAIFSLAWFAGVDALGAQGWRGPFDAALPLFYTALAQVRPLGRHAVAVTGRRWFVHATAVVAVALCFTGPVDQVWWRLMCAFALLAAAYWWQELRRGAFETPWLAWISIAGATLALVAAALTWTWHGTGVIFGALLLTFGWVAIRRVRATVELEEAGFTVLSVLALMGAVFALRQELPQWQQAAGAAGLAGYAFAWWMVVTTPRLRSARATLRSIAGALGTTAVLLASAKLQLDAAYAGLIALVIAAAHSEWNVRARDPVEQWYAIGAALALPLVVYLWPYAHAISALSALEFVLFVGLVLAAGVRRRRWYLAYPAALLLAPALDQSLAALALHGDAELEASCMAGLAWVIGLAGLTARPLAGRLWAWSAEAAGVSVAVVVFAVMSDAGYADPAGIALLAYAPLVYAGAMQDAQRWVLPVAAATALAGAVTLLAAHGADTIYYPAALGAIGLVMWIAGRALFGMRGRSPLVEMHRYVGLGMLAVASLAGFFFPERTGPSSTGAALATAALLVTGGVFWIDGHTFDWRPNLYVGLFAASCAGYFAARYVGLEPWELVPPGLGAAASGILLRQDPRLQVDRRIRRLVVAVGLGLVMGWAAAFTVSGDLFWLVVLLVEGVLAIAAGIVLRSRVLVAGGGVAVAVVSLRALLSIAQAGYLFAAFAAVAIVLLAAATALALGRDRFFAGPHSMTEQMARWD